MNLKSLLFSLLLLGCIGARASHIVGLELYYTYVTGSTYTITLVAYGDCGPASSTAFATLPTATPEVCIYDGNTSVGSILLAVQGPGVEITPVCPADVLNTQCTNPSNTIPGIMKFVYTGTYTVPYASATWRFIFTGQMGGGNMAGRAAAVTNIVSGTTIALEDTLNNTVYNNSNAVMTTVPTPFFCLNHSDSYNPGAVDPESDSLSFSLVDGKIGNGTCGLTGSLVTYTDSFSAPGPLAVDRGTFGFDRQTGQVTFFPNLLQRALVVYNVKEYRGGTFVGSFQREMTFLVLPCTDIPPGGGFQNASAGTIGDSTHFFICADSGLFDLTIYPQEADTNNAITVTASGLPAGAVFNVVNNSTNHPVCTFTWNSTGAAPGSYIYYVTFKDNACPLSGSQTTAFTVSILPLPDVHATGGYVSCLGAPATLTATGALSYQWSPSSGVSCADCAVTRSTVGSTTEYTVTGTDGNGCHNRAVAAVSVDPSPPRFLHDITVSQSIDYGASIQLSVKGAAMYYWTPNDGTLDNCNINNPIASPLKKTTYMVQAYNNMGCMDSASVTIDVITTTEVVPTAFTPNGDGLNDEFRVVNLGYGKLVDMKILNRWGQVVCETIDNKKGWDGTFNGVPQDMGVYYYRLSIEHEDKSVVHYKGEVTLLR